jgi:multiple sugar transport system substrate-binding protein
MFLVMAAGGVTVAAGAMAAGFGRQTGMTGTTLTMIAADYGAPGGGNGSQAYWNDLSRRFSAKHPDITVDIGVYSWNEVDKRVHDMAAEGHPPDIAQIGAYADYAAAGQLYSANDVLSIPVQADFLTSLAEAGEVTRVQYGMPFAASTRLLFYSRDLFAECGLDPDRPPRTWDELAYTADILKQSGVQIPYGLPLGPEEAPAETLLWLLSGGGSYTDEVGTYALDQKANIRTFDWIRDHLVKKGLTNKHPERTDRSQLFDLFAQGKVGMLNGHPTLMRQAAARHVRYGTAPVPGRHGPLKGSLGVADWMMAFRKDGKHRRQIGRFLDFVYAEQNHYDFVDRYDLLPVTTSASERMHRTHSDKDMRPFLEQLPDAEFYPVAKESWAQLSASVKKHIGTAVTPHGDPAAVLRSLQQEGEEAEAMTGGAH